MAMDWSALESLVQRLVENPHDEEALRHAHAQGESDPEGYAGFLERIGGATTDPAYAAHWLTEAASVWAETIGDAHRAARLLMAAVERDPTHRGSADKLSEMYREKGDAKALIALLERRATALGRLAETDEALRGEVAGMHEEMGRLWAEEPLNQPSRAVDHYRRALEFDPNSQYAIFSARELLKSLGKFADALPYYAAELALEGDPARQSLLLRDELEVRRGLGDLDGMTPILGRLRSLDPEDPVLLQEYASSILDRSQAGNAVSAEEKTDATAILVTLARTYGGEHGIAYAGAALDILPGDDAAMQTLGEILDQTGQRDALASRFVAYLAANPTGAFSAEARAAVGDVPPAPPPEPSAPAVAPIVAVAPPTPAPAKKPSVADDLEALLGAKKAPKEEPAPVVDADEVLAEVEDIVDGTSGPLPNDGLSEVDVAAAVKEETPDAPVVAPKEEPVAAEPPKPVKAERKLSEPPPVNPGASRRSMVSLDRLQAMLDEAHANAQSGNKDDAFNLYKLVLESEPSHPEALGWVEDFLRSKRDYAALRDVLLASVRAVGTNDTLETKKGRLREIAGLCEAHLRDPEGAVYAWRQILTLDRTDEGARNTLMRLLERLQRWDDVAKLLEQEATVEGDIEAKISLEKKLARLHEEKRSDFRSAADAWARISNLTPEDDVPVETATNLYEQAEAFDEAAEFLAEHVGSLEDASAREALGRRLAGLQEKRGDLTNAAATWADLAGRTGDAKAWDEAERLAAAAGAPARAATAAKRRAEAETDARAKAAHLFRAAGHFAAADDDDAAILELEASTELDRQENSYAEALLARYEARALEDRIVAFLEKRATVLEASEARVAARRRAARLSAQLGDAEGAERLFRALLDDGDDAEALEVLAQAAARDERWDDAVALLRRQEAVTTASAAKATIALHEAALRDEKLGDDAGAIARYQDVLASMDAASRTALAALGKILERRGDHAGAAEALAKELALVENPGERRDLALRLGHLYEGLGEKKKAIDAYDVVRSVDADDFDTLGRLASLTEAVEDYPRTVELLALLADVEADEDDAANLTIKRSKLLAENLGRPDDALAGLEVLADGGHAAVRETYVALGDAHGRARLVADKLRSWWFTAPAGTERVGALRGSFERYRLAGALKDAIAVAQEVAKLDTSIANDLETLSVQTRDEAALQGAHTILARGKTGTARAEELVRQAEVLVTVTTPVDEALAHAEQGLVGLSGEEAEPLLQRLATLAGKGAPTVDLYERHVTRAKTQEAKFAALLRAAQVAATEGAVDRAKQFLELALSANPKPTSLEELEAAAAAGDATAGGTTLRQALVAALAAGGAGARDGGRTRAAMLRRAADLADRALGDRTQAFAHLEASLIAHVEPETLDALDGLGKASGDWVRVEGVFEAALAEVFDGPLVRQLLGRRAELRRTVTGDKPGAAADLRRLHDLAPQDQPTLEALSNLLDELGDHRGRVQLLEDQILRQKDIEQRSELARQVARMWEERLGDAREAADAWRRVLRMKAQDPEATAGLDRAKTNQLRKSDPSRPVGIPGAAAAAETAPPPEVALDATTRAPDVVEKLAATTAAGETTPDAPAVAPEEPKKPLVAPAAPPSMARPPVSVARPTAPLRPLGGPPAPLSARAPLPPLAAKPMPPTPPTPPSPPQSVRPAPLTAPPVRPSTPPPVRPAPPSSLFGGADNELDDALDALELPDTAAGNIDAPRAFAEVTDDDDVVEVGDMDDVDLLDDDGEGASPTDPPPRSSTVPPPLSKHKA